jgi:short-subunit dehydrogenase
MLNWYGKTVWITGASSGIGRCLATKLAERGATVVISARREEVLNDIASHDPQRLLPLAVDVTDHESIADVQNKLAQRVEALDFIIMAAGTVEYEDDLDFDPKRYQRVFDVNFFGLVNSLAIAMPLLRNSENKPHIIGVTSLVMLLGFPRAEAYGASKAAADYFLKSLRSDLPPEQFYISIARPGFVKTPMTSVNDFPMPFLMTADQAAERIIKGINKRKMFINFPSRFSAILKLLSLAPWLWYCYLTPKMTRYRSTSKTQEQSKTSKNGSGRT